MNSENWATFAKVTNECRVKCFLAHGVYTVYNIIMQIHNAVKYLTSAA